MRQIFTKEGVFVEYNEKAVEIREGDKIVHKKESPTKLWWELKEVVKGKKVKIVVYDLED
ncbi:hypothetical protein PAP_05740 [Palaeococcus pacificus DY20341]|uniref:Uncharacterized protein n=1 Tax=Palaeococcus pacificus DY20341 TaxID=1343739 RepID=A0A075LY85_9EURY|nr:hypothetical protein [Palaeococcus pacificus]AIF69548.1 hypothetical protein PAP_05740 [Palaeococcus pacificus DY20341]